MNDSSARMAYRKKARTSIVLVLIIILADFLQKSRQVTISRADYDRVTLGFQTENNKINMNTPVHSKRISHRTTDDPAYVPTDEPKHTTATATVITDRTSTIQRKIGVLYDTCGCMDTDCMLAYISEIPGHECTQTSNKISVAQQFWMTTRCPQVPIEGAFGWRVLCEVPNWADVSTVTPVFANTTGLHYRNVYCAYCNRAGQFNYWRISASVRYRYSGMLESYWSDPDRFWSNITQIPKVTITFSPNVGAEAPFVCSRHSGMSLSHCPRELGQSVQAGCSETSSLVPVTMHATTYRNPHCLVCWNKTRYTDVVCRERPKSDKDVRVSVMDVLLNFNRKLQQKKAIKEFPDAKPKLGSQLAAEQKILIRGNLSDSSSTAALAWYRQLFVPVLLIHLSDNTHTWLHIPEFSISSETVYHQLFGPVKCIVLSVRVTVQIQMESNASLSTANETLSGVVASRFTEENLGLIFSTNFGIKEINECQSFGILTLLETNQARPRSKGNENKCGTLGKNVSDISAQHGCKDIPILNHPAVTFNETAAGVITYVCMSVSNIGLLIVILIHPLLPNLRTFAYKLTLNLCVSLLLSQTLFMAGVEANNDVAVCVGVSVVLHYLWLTAVLWMNACGIHIFRTFRNMQSAVVASRNENRMSFIPYAVYSYLFPVGIVSVCLCLHFTILEQKVYGGLYCFITHPLVLAYGFALPLGLIILSNAFFLGQSMRTIHSLTSNRHLEHQHERTHLSIYAKLSVVLGLTWIVGFVATWTGIRALWYVFDVLNGLQGLVIFFTYTCKRSVFLALRSRFRKSAATQNAYPAKTKLSEMPEKQTTSIDSATSGLSANSCHT